MAVHFDFIVDDVDAENIFFSIRNDALKCDEYIMDAMTRKDISEEYRQSTIDAWRASKSYTLGLLELMKNTRVEE
jgi:hypothetical protein